MIRTINNTCAIAMSLLIAVVVLTWVAPAAHAANTARPCKFEDSRNCVWDARHMGNGQGRSFVVSRKGKVTFITHRRAHRLLNGR